jgi:hypothetical protein
MKSRRAVSSLPNDVFEKVDGEEYPQEYMSPSPTTMGSGKPGEDILLTGRMVKAELHREIVRRNALLALGMKSRRK